MQDRIKICYVMVYNLRSTRSKISGKENPGKKFQNFADVAFSQKSCFRHSRVRFVITRFTPVRATDVGVRLSVTILTMITTYFVMLASYGNYYTLSSIKNLYVLYPKIRIFFSLSQCLPFQISLTLPFYCLRVQLVFLIFQSQQFILSLLFSKYFFRS